MENEKTNNELDELMEIDDLKKLKELIEEQ